MGFFDKIKQVVTLAPEAELRTAVFDHDWLETMASLKTEIQGSGKQITVGVSFPDQLCIEISTAIKTHSPSPRVPYSPEKVPLNNVGESFRQQELSEMCLGKPGEDMEWLSGFLMPEILNPFDRTAVGIMAIQEISNPQTSDKFNVVQVGYMEKESAKKVHKKILNLLGKDLYIPLLIRMTGGTKEKLNYGAFPYAMTDKIEFD